MDTFILIFSAACDWHDQRSPLAEIVTVAVLAILEHLTLYSMSEDDCPDGGHGGNTYVAYGGAANYAYGLQVSEDKQRRVDAWLTELRAAEDQMPPQQYRPASTIVAESNVSDDGIGLFPWLPELMGECYGLAQSDDTYGAMVMIS
ncbi:unnamed protein product [Clonostachys rosea]|uniref:Uncharacterized protein n=1 Tax=Bionectria ochroleuca TaxID=29856 RepID=A0ABY6TRB3_BIOOC|nr:unnamed protein product [Clonostachys rosea]